LRILKCGGCDFMVSKFLPSLPRELGHEGFSFVSI
jgi:hypothetical protein